MCLCSTIKPLHNPVPAMEDHRSVPDETQPYDPGADEYEDLMWPTLLTQPVRPPFLVYLDLNHWIGLAQAAAGHPKGARYGEALQACRQARASETFLFPLSVTHLMEVSKISSRQRRADLAVLMEELSGFMMLLGWSDVMELELETALDDLIGPRSAPIEGKSVLGWGALFAMGQPDSIIMTDSTGTDVSEQVRSQMGGEHFDALISEMKTALQRLILNGPQDDDQEEDLRDRGWTPDAANRTAQKRAATEQELVEILNAAPQWRRGRLMDVLQARHLFFEMINRVTAGTMARGQPSLGLTGGPLEARRFTRSMPSAEVAIAMKWVYHRNPQTIWTSNTIFDIDAMAVAVPYCDAVVTDAQVADSLKRMDLNQRMSTEIMASPDDLTNWLDDQQ